MNRNVLTNAKSACLSSIIAAPSDQSPTLPAEAAIIDLFISSLGKPDDGRAPALRAPPGSDTSVPMLLMSALKTHVAARLPADGEAGATKAVYALVAKQVFKIDRRSRDPYLYQV